MFFLLKEAHFVLPRYGLTARCASRGNYYPREQFLFIKTEDLYKKPAEIVQQTLEFLGVSADKIDTNREYKKYKVPSKKGYKTRDSAPTMDPKVREYLVEYFRPHNARLYEFLGRDFGWDK